MQWNWRPAFAAAITLLCSIVRLAAAESPGAWQAERFDRELVPLLVNHCLECHSGSEPKGGLDLTSSTAFRRGGDSGPPLTGKGSAESLLWQRVDAGEMPPGDRKLSASERATLKAWLDANAPWGQGPIRRFAVTTERRAGYDWWSLQPLRRPETPATRQSEWIRNPIDAFVLHKLEQEGLTPSREASPRVLLRRLSFDLIGLPPAPGELDIPETDDAEAAIARNVDRLLGSRHFGERWARHWLDLARFGESQGFERDKLRPNSWRYRDWVVQAFNEDLPYDEFARLQIAGDVLFPEQAEAITATGFLVAGAYDEVGQNQQSAAMRAVVRQDELEDLVATTMQGFLGLTVNCARCHDHKFDPVTQREYYRLTAALAGVRHGERAIRDPQLEQQLARLRSRRGAIREQLETLESSARSAVLKQRLREADHQQPAPVPLARWTFDSDLRDSIGTLHGTPHGAARVEDGHLVLDGRQAYVSTAPVGRALTAKTLEAWVKLDNLEQRGGAALSVQNRDGGQFDAIVFGEREPRHWMAGSNNFLRTQSFQGTAEGEAAQRVVHVAIVYQADGVIRAYRDGVPYGQSYDSGGVARFEPDASEVLFGLRHGTSAGGNRMLAGRIDQAQLYDRALSEEEVARSANRRDYVSETELVRQLGDEQQRQRTKWKEQLTELDRMIGQIQSPKVYAVAPKPPGPVHVLARGNPANPGATVTAGGLSAVRGLSADFGLPEQATDAQRRIELARWMSSEQNPLFARVIVNRLWHYHFGVGLVETPNDFGFQGGQPSHPELLDWLASDLIANHWSLKHIHRLIVESATYRQDSRNRPECAAVDAGNRLLWRKSPVRLEAEALRDTVLAVSGQLNAQIGGPPYRDFKTFTRNTQFYEMIDPVGPEFHRRTLYRTWIRSGRNWFLDVFDCPDPSTTAPARAVTTTPLQSLTLMNNSFVLRMADHLADRARSEAGADISHQVDRIYRLAYGRAASPDELRVATEFVSQHSLGAFCRVIFNSNEFLYVD